MTASAMPSTISAPPMNIQQPFATGLRVAQPHVGDVGAELGDAVGVARAGRVGGGSVCSCV